MFGMKSISLVPTRYCSATLLAVSCSVLYGSKELFILSIVELLRGCLCEGWYLIVT
jgi:hypothetical protein